MPDLLKPAAAGGTAYLYTFLYPRPKTRAFDYEHHRQVHMPMGVGLAKRFLGIEPNTFWIERIDEDRPDSESPYCAIVHLLFEREEDRDKLSEMRNVPEAVHLARDYDNYTDMPPEVRLSRVTIDDDMGAVLKKFEAIWSGASPLPS